MLPKTPQLLIQKSNFYNLHYHLLIIIHITYSYWNFGFFGESVYGYLNQNLNAYDDVCDDGGDGDYYFLSFFNLIKFVMLLWLLLYYSQGL